MKMNGVERVARLHLELNAPKHRRAGGRVKPPTFTSAISAAQEVPGCMSLRSVQQCRVTSSASSFPRRLEQPELFSHVHGPAVIEKSHPPFRWPQLRRNQCFTLTKVQWKKDLDDDLGTSMYSDKCPAGEIRGQILSL
jgi:hypothetical protein